MWVILKALVSGELHPLLPPLLSFLSSTPGNEACCLPVTWRCFPLWYSLLSIHSYTHTHMHTHSEGEVNAVKRRIKGILVALFVFYAPKPEKWDCVKVRACVGLPACRCLQADREWKLRHMLIRCCDDGRAEGEKRGGRAPEGGTNGEKKRWDFSRQGERKEISENHGREMHSRHLRRSREKMTRCCN